MDDLLGQISPAAGRTVLGWIKKSFQINTLRIFFLSRHVSLRELCDLVTKDRIKDYLRRIFSTLPQLGNDEGIVTIARLNLHSGEHSLCGNEEVNEISPAIAALQAEDYRIKETFACVLSLCHAQGHIGAKAFDFVPTKSMTCGRPILRTHS